jgi:eukaryotic-like serine/threonine-protein kinase
MTDMSDTRDPVEMLAEEFLDRHRRGERPTISEYAEAHPEWSDRIRSLFPTLMMIEGLKSGTDSPSGSGSAARGAEIPSRLGDFHIQREIGRGGMGVVYLAQQDSLGRLVALKVLAPELMASPRTVERFRREAQAAARLHHTNIVPVFGTGEDQGLHFYVMQSIEGQSLDRVLGTLNPSGTVGETGTIPDEGESVEEPESPFALCSAEQMALHLIHGQIESSSTLPREAESPTAEWSGNQSDASVDTGQQPTSAESHPPRQPNGRPLGRRYWRNVAAIGMQAASAVHYAHRQGTLHRDIKPGNLMLGRSGTVWVTDFGLAKLAEQDDLTRPGDMIGTLRYMAPEQLEGISDRRTDIYSLGLTLYELLTLRPAFDATQRGMLLRQVSHDTPPRPRNLNRTIPRDLETIVLKATAREPERRYQSAGDLAEDLQRFLDDRPIRARRVSPIEHAWRWCRRNPALASVSVLALTLLVMVTTGMSFGYYHRTRALATETGLREKGDATLQLAADAFAAIFDQIGGPSTSSVFQETADGNVTRSSAGPSRVSPQDAALLEDILGFYDRFAQVNRDNEHWLHETAVARRRMGQIYQRLGRVDEATASYQRSLEEYARLDSTETCPEDLAVETALIHNELGAMSGALGRFGNGVEHHRQALQILEDASTTEASSSSYRFELARTYLFLAKGIAIVSVLGSEPDEASKQPPPIAQWLDRSLELLNALTIEDPKDGDTRFFMAECLHLLWLTKRLSGEIDDDSSGPTEALAALEQLVEEFPDNPRYQSALSHAYMVANRSPLSDRGYRATREQREQLERGVAMAAHLMAEYPDASEYKDLLGRCNCALADLLLDMNELDKAGRLCRQAIAMCDEAHESYPSTSFYHIGYLRARSLLAGIQRIQGQLDEAHDLLLKAIEGESAMPPEMAGSAIVRRFQAEAYLQLAEIYQEKGDVPRSEEAAETARSIIEELPPIMQRTIRIDRWKKRGNSL